LSLLTCTLGTSLVGPIIGTVLAGTGAAVSLMDAQLKLNTNAFE
jgi:hypothetical protein